MSKSTSDRSPVPSRDTAARKSAHGATIAAIGAALAVLLVIWYVVGAVDHGATARSHIQHRLDDTQSRLSNLENEFRERTGVAPEPFETTTTNPVMAPTTTTTTIPKTGQSSGMTPTTARPVFPTTTPPPTQPPPPTPSTSPPPTTTPPTTTLLPCIRTLCVPPLGVRPTTKQRR